MQQADNAYQIIWLTRRLFRALAQKSDDSLQDAGILATAVNPRHKRSPLIALTGKGKGLYQKIKARDARAIKKMFSNVPEKDRCITQKTLETLLAELNSSTAGNTDVH